MSDSDHLKEALKEVLLANRSIFAALMLGTFAVGAYIVVASMSLHFLYRRKTNSTASRITIIYTWSMLLITIVWIYCNTRISEVQLLEDSPISANHPEILSYCSVTNIAGTLSATLLFFGSDALLFFRLYMLCKRRWKWIAVPGALYVSYIGIGIAINLVCFSPEFGGHLPLPPLNLLANVFYIATAAVPTILTPIICSKLLLHRHRMAKQSEVLRGNSTLYLSIVAVVVESAIPYVLCSWIWVALFITNNRAWVWFEGFLLATSILSEACIVLRIAMGHAYPGVQFVQTSEACSKSNGVAV